MKYLNSFLNNKSAIILSICILISTLLHMRDYQFPPLNSDEASFAYNAYSILKTGRDEYGEFMPLRFTAFGENKLPVTIYSIVPFIALFGLSEVAARLPFILIGIVSPVLFYLLTTKITQNKAVALTAAFLASVSPWIQIMSRHIHENIIILGIVLAILWYLSDLNHRWTRKTILILAALIGVALFTYHIGKVLAVGVIVWIIGRMIHEKMNRTQIINTLLILLIPVVVFGVTEILNPTTRISNLFLTSTPGFEAGIQQLRLENDNRILHNKLTYGAQIALNQYFSYFSPEFLVAEGDMNVRFGFKGISPITYVEWVFIGIGIAFAMKNKLKDRYLLLALFTIAPVSAAISWQESSLTRSFIMIVPIIIFTAYGLYKALQSLKSNTTRIIMGTAVSTLFLFQLFYSWNFYFNHYMKRPEVLSSWQAGYKEVGEFVKENYDNFDRFYITSQSGQPYIFMLFYLGYAPEQYHKQATLSELDQYGFGQVESFDKFIFEYRNPDSQESAAFIGQPGEFPEGTDMARVTKIELNGQELFWVYEGQRNK